MSPTPDRTARFTPLRYWRNRSVPTQWAWGAAALVVLASVVTLLLLLIQATDNTRSYERNFRLLVGVNIGIVAVLVTVIALVVGRLWLRLKRGKFGSRLLMRLAAILALMGILPGVLIYTVSVQFVSRSIESWFDVKVEAALESGLNLGRASLDALADELGSRTRAAASELADSTAVGAVAVDRIRERLNADSVTLWSSSGQLLANAQAAGSALSSFGLTSDRPSASAMRNARSSRVTVQIDAANALGAEAAPAYSLRALAWVPAAGFGLTEQPRYLQVVTAVPAALAANTAAVEAAYTEYQERAIGRKGLQRMYLGTLTLALFLSVFAAVLMAVLLGNQIAQPLLVLADGVRQVAEGDLSPKKVTDSADELGGLTRSFATMTQQLADARAAAEHSNDQVAAARSSLQTILDNLTAGVLVVGADGRLIAANPGATRVLRAPLAAHLGRPMTEVPGLRSFATMVQEQFETLAAEGPLRDNDYWQQSVEFSIDDRASQAGDNGATLAGLAMADAPASLLCRGALLPDGTRLVVIDDLTELISAQRAVAWGEVARRLAHEIKNPLTPIQLSAERLQHKLAAQLDEPGSALLARSVNTIVTQVGAMQRLVNEFRDYARLPSAELVPMDLNALVQEVLSMYDSPSSVRVETVLDEDLPLIEGDAGQLRQVVHNLLQNAMDASEGLPERQVTLRTQWLPPTTEAGGLGRVRLVIADNGTGFADKVFKRAFEPYVTTKAKGTGLGLAVVKKIIEEHGARIDLSNRTGARSDADTQITGARVSIIFSKLAAKAGASAAATAPPPAANAANSHA
jgi:nitrogen fixation/metabolism regulation signal transduction histidine kinase